MRIIDNDALYTRNTRIGFGANLLGVALIVAASYVLFTNPIIPFGLYLGLMIGGIVMLQVGLFMSRWSRRPDWELNEALQGLNNEHTIYHHRGPVPHLLVGPAGLWILMPKFTLGTISYDAEKQRWRAQSANLFTALYRRLTQEGIGRPHYEAMYQAADLDRFLQKHWDSKDSLHVQVAVVFVDPRADVRVEHSELPAASIKDLKGLILKGDPQAKLSKAQIKKLNEVFQPA